VSKDRQKLFTRRSWSKTEPSCIKKGIAAHLPSGSGGWDRGSGDQSDVARAGTRSVTIGERRCALFSMKIHIEAGVYLRKAPRCFLRQLPGSTTEIHPTWDRFTQYTIKAKTAGFSREDD
jgi:hypothetical protein